MRTNRELELENESAAQKRYAKKLEEGANIPAAFRDPATINGPGLDFVPSLEPLTAS